MNGATEGAGDPHGVSADQRLLDSQRVLVVGPSGSGKTTLTKRLAELLDLESIHLDAEFWRVGWIRTPEAEWRAKVHELASRSSWIMDGTYEDSLELRLPRAETLIVVRASRLASLWGVVKRRAVSGVRARVDAPAGQRLDAPFLRYVWRFPRDAMPIIEQRIESHGGHLNRIDLTGRRAVIRFVRRLEERLEAAGQGTP